MHPNTTTEASGHHHGAPIGNEGLFISHSFLGTFVLGLGFWWWIQCIRKCFRKTRRPLAKYQAEVSYSCGCFANKIGEGLIKILCSLVGMGVEAFTERLGRHHEYAHYPFYTAMLVAGLLDVLQSTVIYLPDGIDYVSHILPFVFQAYCSRAHAYDQPHVTATCHYLSSYIGVVAATGILCEMGIRNSFIISWIKCFVVMLSGAWTWQMAIILNPVNKTPWDEQNHDNVMNAAVLAALQMCGIGFVQLFTLALVTKYQGVSPDWTDHDSTAKEMGNSSSRDKENTQYMKLLNPENVEQ